MIQPNLTTLFSRWSSLWLLHKIPTRTPTTNGSIFYASNVPSFKGAHVCPCWHARIEHFSFAHGRHLAYFRRQLVGNKKKQLLFFLNWLPLTHLWFHTTYMWSSTIFLVIADIPSFYASHFKLITLILQSTYS